MGVPYEFVPAEDIKEIVWGHRGSHGQPPGTWSDDGALMLALLDSLLSMGFDPHDQGRRALRWLDRSAYAPGERFDIGLTTSSALERFRRGVPAAKAGLDGEHDNGNGSLMRILPIALVGSNASPKMVVDQAMEASALTHRHPRAQVVCAVYCLAAQSLLKGASPDEALDTATMSARCVIPPNCVRELDCLEAFSQRSGSGYVVDTFWSAWHAFTSSRSYAETIEAAIALGNDTDTTAAVAGGLAGLYWGLSGIPHDWLSKMRGQDIVKSLIDRLVTSTSQIGSPARQRRQ